MAPYAEESIEDDGDDDGEVEAYNISLTEYLQYFEKTWIGCLNKRTQVCGKPLIAFQYWSKYDDVLQEKDLTNNSAEAWNS